MDTIAFSWDLVLDKLREQQCLLVLGAEIFTDSSGTSHHTRLLNYLELPENHHHLRHYTKDGFFLFDSPFKRTFACHAIKNFYKDILPENILMLLAQVPFHVALSVTPDKLLHRAFDAQDFTYQSGWYKKNKDPQPIKPPTSQNPLIYNVFGSIDSDESLVITYDDLYDYFKSIFARKSMPQLLKDQLKEVKNILFLGVSFDKWYMQLILRELEIHNHQYDFIRYAANQKNDKDLRTFCFEQFKINFVPHNDISGFVFELHHRCSDAGILRKSGGTAELTLPEKVRKLVATAKTEEAIGLLCDVSEGTDWQDDATQLAGRFSMFYRRALNGLLRSDERDIQESNINDAILQLLKKI